MKTRKLLGKIILFSNRIRNIFLLIRFPWLAPRRYKDDSIAINKWFPLWTMLDDMPEGWRKAFGMEMCRDIHKFLKENNHLKDYRIFQIKEKFGELRWYDNYNDAEFYRIKSKYIELSRYTCIECGKEADYVSKGWIAPWCYKHAHKYYYKVKYRNKEFDACYSPVNDYWKSWKESSL